MSNFLKEQQTQSDESGLPKKEVLTLKEACRFLGVSASYIYKLTSGRRIPHYCPQGKMLFFDRSEVIAWALQNKRTTKKEAYDNAPNEILSR